MTIEGAMTAIVTPFRDGNVDYDSLGRLIDRQIEAGIDGIVAVGTTGESATLSMEEHVDVIKFVIEHTAKRVPVIAGTGGNSTSEAIELSVASEKLGADALLHVVPYYNKPTQEGMYQHFTAIAASTDLPIVLYNVPGRTVADLLPETVARLAEHPRFVAIKEATANMHRAAQIISRVPDDFTVLSGDDFTAFTLYTLGGHGVISVVSNVMPAQMAEMWKAAKAGHWDRARELHYQILPVTEALFAEPNPMPVKEALAMMGQIQPDIRLPLVRCSEPVRARLKEQLVRAGLL